MLKCVVVVSVGGVEEGPLAPLCLKNANETVFTKKWREEATEMLRSESVVLSVFEGV